MKIIIHAGRHKTGTTYLQQFLGMNASLLLKDFGILYPESGRNKYFNYHHEFFQGLVTGGNEEKAIINELKQEIEETNPEIVLFSSEYLSRSSIQNKELNTIKECLPETDIEIIFYLRRQDNFLCSRYAEQVKRGLLAYPDTIWDINAELDYFKFLERYAYVFGNSNLNVRSYDQAIESGLVEDFSECLGEPRLAQLPRPPVGANNRLPWRYLNFLWYANSKPLLRKFVSNRFTSLIFRKGAQFLPKLFDGKRPLTKSEARFLLEKYSESNDKVKKIYSNGSSSFKN
tara:strand:- start:23416 stop:24276 length:861 start_codon:yes stop_codon:yes gene_type:complete